MTEKKGSAAAPAGEPPEETVTSRDEAAEPAGDEDPANEAEGVEAVEEAAKGDDSKEEDPLAAARRERDEYLDLARRAQADFENYRKRAAREAAASGERARGGLVRELLPVVDNLERALGSAGSAEGQLAKGVALVHSELIAVLERNGVERSTRQARHSTRRSTRRSPRARRMAPSRASCSTSWRRATARTGRCFDPPA